MSQVVLALVPALNGTTWDSRGGLVGMSKVVRWDLRIVSGKPGHLCPSLKFPTTCWSPHSNSPPPAGPLTQIPHHLLHHLLVLSLKFPTTCWSPHSNSPSPAASLTQISHHLLVPSLNSPPHWSHFKKLSYLLLCCHLYLQRSSQV